MNITGNARTALELLDEHGELYGLELAWVSEGKIKEGTVYWLLRRLSESGYVDSALEAEGGRGTPKRYYWLTTDGRRALANAKREQAGSPTTED